MILPGFENPCFNELLSFRCLFSFHFIFCFCVVWCASFAFVVCFRCSLFCVCLIVDENVCILIVLTTSGYHNIVMYSILFLVDTALINLKIF